MIYENYKTECWKPEPDLNTLYRGALSSMLAGTQSIQHLPRSGSIRRSFGKGNWVEDGEHKRYPGPRPLLWHAFYWKKWCKFAVSVMGCLNTTGWDHTLEPDPDNAGGGKKKYYSAQLWSAPHLPMIFTVTGGHLWPVAYWYLIFIMHIVKEIMSRGIIGWKN